MAASRKRMLSICGSRYLMFIYAFGFGFTFHLTLGIDLNIVHPSRLLSMPESSCFFTLSSLSNPGNREIVYHLADVSFRQDTSLGFGLIDLSTFKWPNGNNLSYVTDNENTMDKNAIILFIKNSIDRSCLLLPSNIKLKSNIPTEMVYDGPVTVDHLVTFLNDNCNVYRYNDGSLTVEGMHREHILQSLFHVENVSTLNMEKLIKIEREESKLAEKDCDYKEQLVSSKMCSPSDKEKSKPRKLFQPEINLPIPQCKKIPLPSRSEFFHEYLTMSKPVVIQGATKDWSAFKKWTNKYLRKKFGNRTVHIKLTQGGEYEGVAKASLWDNYKTFQIPRPVFNQLQFPDLVVVRPAAHNVKFSQFLDIVESVSSGKLQNVSAYLEYSSLIQYMPELKADIKEMPFFHDLLQLKHLNMWLSDGNTLGKLHFDQFDNFLCQISGQKQVIMYGPHDGAKMYEGHLPEAILSFDRRNNTFRRKTLLDSTSMVMSPVDIVSPDIERFPLFGDAYPINCTINEGEVLFMPSFWWHEVQSRPDIKTGRNLAVNFWYEPFLTKSFPCPECKLDVNPKYRHLL